ncbi:MAG TPA: DUF2778 domain-containing protein [Rhodoblastus sp.]|nr:DUF2778 domain-containing protein [Rhodoblastus sp.]
MQTDPYVFDDLHDYRLPRRRRWRRTAASLAGSAVAVAFLGAVGTQMLQTAPSADAPSADAPSADAPILRAAENLGPLAPRIALRAGAELLDPNYSLGGKPAGFSLEPVADANLRPATTIAGAQMTDLRGRLADTETQLEPPQAVPTPAPRPLDLAMAEPEDAFTPLPPRRPVDLAPSAAERGPAAAQADQPPAEPAQPRLRAPRGGRTIVARAEPPKEQGFFEKLFGGVSGGASPAMAYAPPDGGLNGGGARLTGVAPSSSAAVSDRFTAVYDISARTVYLPDGTRLEAHSGLGDMMDKPAFAHVRMRGVTPPALYDLREREALFHGVRAIRLTPVNSAVHGRAGLLAHTYMLGPSGQSNGCVSFRDYQRFLAAFLNGQVKRLKVVASL